MQHHKRRTPRPVMRAISGVFQLASKPARERAYRGDYRLLRKVVDAAGSAKVPGVRTRDEVMDGIGVRAAPEHEAVTDGIKEFLQQRGLAYPGLAGNQNRGTGARFRLLEITGQCLQLFRAPDE